MRRDGVWLWANKDSLWLLLVLFVYLRHLVRNRRYKTLDRQDQERMLILLRHLGFFVHGPMREHCPANPNCMDTIIEQVIKEKAHRSVLPLLLLLLLLQ